MTQAFGFSVAATQKTLWVTLLVLEKPPTGPIAGKYKLYEYTQQIDMGGKETAAKDNAVWDDLGQFLLSPNLPCPFWDAPLLDKHCSSPGYMLLPKMHAATDDPNHDGGDWQVIPTITGSLVIRATNDYVVTQLLQFGAKTTATTTTSEKNSNHQHNDTEKYSEDISSMLTSLQNLILLEIGKDDKSKPSTANTRVAGKDDDVWYIKFKTPPFGIFWDTAAVAINGTRSLLQRQPLSAKNNDSSHHGLLFVQEWLRMYPMDSHIIENSRSITIMRSVGSPFKGQEQLSWKEFQWEFAFLIKGTIYFQNLCNNLIHGDINEGNVLYDETATRGSRFKLIDWDEALRGRPCHRQITTEEERWRYPRELVSFPEQYTKQQFLHLFQTLVLKHYHSIVQADEKWKDDVLWSKFLRRNGQDKRACQNGRSFLHRATVDAHFKELLEILQEDG